MDAAQEARLVKALRVKRVDRARPSGAHPVLKLLSARNVQTQADLTRILTQAGPGAQRRFAEAVQADPALAKAVKHLR